MLSTVTAALASGNVAIVQLLYLGFATPIALNSSTWDLAFGGVTYKGAYGLGTISPISDTPGQVQGITLSLAAGDSARISLALDGSDVVQGTPCILRTAIVETVNYTVLDAPVDWTGTLDTMSIVEDGATANVSVTAESRAVVLLRGDPMFYSDADQKTINPADGFFSYVIDQTAKPVIWPAREFFMK